jgi:hypothetical protein
VIEILFQNIIKRNKKKLGAPAWGTPVLEPVPQMDEAVLAPPIRQCRAYLGGTGGDALTAPSHYHMVSIPGVFLYIIIEVDTIIYMVA